MEKPGLQRHLWVAVETKYHFENLFEIVYILFSLLDQL